MAHQRIYSIDSVYSRFTLSCIDRLVQWIYSGNGNYFKFEIEQKNNKRGLL